MTVFVYTCAAYSYLTSHTQHALSRTFVFTHVQSTFRVLTASNRLNFTGLFGSLFSATAAFSSLSSLSSEWSLPKAARGSFLKRASNEFTCWDVPDHQMGSVECYPLCLHQCQRNSGIFKSEKKLMSMSCLCQTFAYVQPTPSWLVLRIYYDLPLFGRRPFPFVMETVVIIFLKAEPECFVSLLRNCV